MKTDITVILDRSGSMDLVKHDTIGGFNSFLETQRNQEGTATLTLTQFSNRVNSTKTLPLEEVESLNTENYIPSGGTALLDALGESINSAGKRFSDMKPEDRPDQVIFVIITDGEENSSKEFTRDHVREMIEHQQSKYSWKFIYLGANQDSFTEAQSYGIGANTTANYTSSGEGTKRAWDVASCSVTRGRKSMNMSITPEERADLET